MRLPYDELIVVYEVRVYLETGYTVTELFIARYISSKTYAQPAKEIPRIPQAVQ